MNGVLVDPPMTRTLAFSSALSLPKNSQMYKATKFYMNRGKTCSKGYNKFSKMAKDLDLNISPEERELELNGFVWSR
jgi:hypothetical protein